LKDRKWGVSVTGGQGDSAKGWRGRRARAIHEDDRGPRGGIDSLDFTAKNKKKPNALTRDLGGGEKPKNCVEGSRGGGRSAKKVRTK